MITQIVRGAIRQRQRGVETGRGILLSGDNGSLLRDAEHLWELRKIETVSTQIGPVTDVVPLSVEEWEEKRGALLHADGASDLAEQVPVGQLGDRKRTPQEEQAVVATCTVVRLVDSSIASRSVDKWADRRRDTECPLSPHGCQLRRSQVLPGRLR